MAQNFLKVKARTYPAKTIPRKITTLTVHAKLGGFCYIEQKKKEVSVTHYREGMKVKVEYV